MNISLIECILKIGLFTLPDKVLGKEVFLRSVLSGGSGVSLSVLTLSHSPETSIARIIARLTLLTENSVNVVVGTKNIDQEEGRGFYLFVHCV